MYACPHTRQQSTHMTIVSSLSQYGHFSETARQPSPERERERDRGERERDSRLSIYSVYIYIHMSTIYKHMYIYIYIFSYKSERTFDVHKMRHLPRCSANHSKASFRPIQPEFQSSRFTAFATISCICHKVLTQ